MNIEEISIKREVARVRAILASGKQIKLHIKGASMLPLLREKTDTVLLALPQRVRRGDIALYQRGSGDVVLHRVIGQNAQGFTMRGDSQQNAEYGITPEQIVGVAVSIERRGRPFSVRHPLYRIYALMIRLRCVRGAFRLLQRGRRAWRAYNVRK
jgi:signal peptidase I